MICETCNDSTEIDIRCKACENKSSQYECKVCQNSGIADTIPCPDCEECPRCGGHGKIYHISKSLDEGFYHGQIIREECPDCDGTGRRRIKDGNSNSNSLHLHYNSPS